MAKRKKKFSREVQKKKKTATKGRESGGIGKIGNCSLRDSAIFCCNDLGLNWAISGHVSRRIIQSESF